MSRFGIRKLIIRILGGTPSDEIVEYEGFDEEDNEAAFSHIIQLSGQPAQTTLRVGPASPEWAMRVVDCAAMMDPSADGEVAMLLSAGWEPFGVQKFSSITGAEGVRIYFKRPNTGVQPQGGPSWTAEG